MKSIVSRLEKNVIFDERIMLGRCLLALSTIITLIFNNIHEMTDSSILLQDAVAIQKISWVRRFSIFQVFDPTIGQILSIIILLIVITGFFPKITSILHFWISVSLYSSFIIVEGGDQIASNLTLLLIPICILDNRKNQWYKPQSPQNRSSVNVFVSVYYFLIPIQVAIIYLHAAIGKLEKEDWLDGTSLYYWFTNNVYGAPNWLQQIYSTILLSSYAPIFTWFVLILELGLFACILATNKYIKRTFLVLGLFFHLGIILTHGLVSFYFAMAGALVLYLADRDILIKLNYRIKSIRYEKRI